MHAGLTGLETELIEWGCLERRNADQRHRRWQLLVRFFCSSLLISAISSTPAVQAQAPSPRLLVDANQDGILAIKGLSDPRAPQDQTSLDQPFVFWTNNDQDDRKWYETVPVKTPDLETPRPDSLRDLEDLERLHIDPAGSIDAEQFSSASLELSWSPVSGAPAIGLFLDADPECNGRYLTHQEVAAKQLTEPFATILARVTIDGHASIPLDSIPLELRNPDRICFLWEGHSIGAGTLNGAIRLPDGVTLPLQPTHLALHHIKSLYQRIRVRWPDQGNPPWSYINEPPPEYELFWEDDPMDYLFHRPWNQSNDIIIMVVGWTRETRDGYRKSLIEAMETTVKRLRHRGYKGRFDVFRWDTRKYLMGFGMKESEYRAFKSGDPLRDYVHSLPLDHTVHVMGHSMGGIVLLEALKLGMQADTAVFLQTVVPSEAVDPDPELFYPGAENLKTPDLAEDLGYRGYLTKTNTPIYNFFNQQDLAFMGWDTVSKGFKPSRSLTRGYYFDPNRAKGEQVYMRAYGSDRRAISDPHESMALVALPRTYALGAEPRVQGAVLDSFDLNAPGLDFALEHGAQFSRNIQQTTAFYDLLLDTFGLPYRGVEQ